MTESLPLYVSYEPEGIYLVAPFTGRRRLIRGWGENPAHYVNIRIAGMPLYGHNGLDFEMSPKTPILATDSGQVITLGYDEAGYGRFIKIRHRWGESVYAHLHQFTVESGQHVERSQPIGIAGGSAHRQKHLHFSIRIDPYNEADGWGGYTNPLPFLEPSNLLLPQLS